MFGNDCLWLLFWWSYFRQFPLVNGWTQQDVVTVWGISAYGIGLSNAIFGNAGNLAGLIKEVESTGLNKQNSTTATRHSSTACALSS